ncbi:MAG: hypothetical protein Q8Q50_01475, partial [Methylobacter sp.]|nr:hypothetical protein [Methylobacter sp.]
MHYKFLLSLSIMALGSLTPAQASDYVPPEPGGHGQIRLNKVTINNGEGNSESTGALLKALDKLPLYGGQIYQLESTFNAEDSEDASYNVSDGKLIIPTAMQGALNSHNLT